MGRVKTPAHRGHGELGREARLLEDRRSDDEGDAFRGQHQLRTVSDREVAGVLVDICCELKGLEDAEKENGWPQRAGKVVLQIALTRLARHYGVIKDDKPKPAGRGLRHWGSEDYRPTLDAWKSGRSGECET